MLWCARTTDWPRQIPAPINFYDFELPSGSARSIINQENAISKLFRLAVASVLLPVALGSLIYADPSVTTPQEVVAVRQNINKSITSPPQVIPNFDAEILQPLQQKQADEAREAAKQAEAQRLANEAAQAAQVVYTAPVQVSRPVVTGSAKAFIYAMESGNNPGAINASSGACGLGQALPCSKLPCSLSDYACQDNWFTGYMLGRYGSWEAARSFWQLNRWW